MEWDHGMCHDFALRAPKVKYIIVYQSVALPKPWHCQQFHNGMFHQFFQWMIITLPQPHWDSNFCLYRCTRVPPLLDNCICFPRWKYDSVQRSGQSIVRLWTRFYLVVSGQGNRATNPWVKLTDGPLKWLYYSLVNILANLTTIFKTVLHSQVRNK